MADHLFKIDIKPYDQVLALTQHMINNGIDNLYRRLDTGEIIDDAKLPKEVNAYADEHNFMSKVTFGPPAVVIDADFSNVTKVILGLHLKSGKCQLRQFLDMDKETGEPVVEKWIMPIEDWVINIPVDVGFVKVDPTTKRGKAIAQRSAAKGKPDHSIYELLMDLSVMKSDNAKWSPGTWSEDDWIVRTVGDNKQPPRRPTGWQSGEPRDFLDFDRDFQLALALQIGKLAYKLQEANLSSLGFAIMAEDANKRATFEVNNVRYQTYPWTDPETKNTPTPGLDGDGRLNYLLYLETVAEHSPPKDSDPASVLSTRMGNWTEGRKPAVDAQSEFGTFILSASNFMESYLLPKFWQINRMLSTDISEVTSWAKDKFFSYKWSVGANFGIGLADPDNLEPFKLKRDTTLTLNKDWQNEAKDFLRPLTESPGNSATVWSYQDIKWGSTEKHAYAHDGAVEVWHYGDTITFVRLFIITGSNQIVYEGRTWTKFEYKIDPNILDPNVYGKITCETKWKITLQMTEVSDGGMTFNIHPESPETNITRDQSNSYKYIEDCLKEMYSIAAMNFEYYLNSLRNCLQGVEKFTLPASGVYYFKNPVMGSKGDLVCGLEYNGNPKLEADGKINEGAEVRNFVPQGLLTNMPDMAKYTTGDEKEVSEDKQKERKEKEAKGKQ